MEQQSVDVKRLPRYCVVCGGEYGPGLETHCTDKSLVAIKRVGPFKKETLFFTLDGEALSEDDLSRMRETETARVATWKQEQREESKRRAKLSPERPTFTDAKANLAGAEAGLREAQGVTGEGRKALSDEEKESPTSESSESPASKETKIPEMSAEPQDKVKRNTQAIASLILGVISIVFALFNYAPGLLSALGFVGATATLLAFLAGKQGLRAARELDGQGRKLAVAGMVIGGLGLLVFIATFIALFTSEMKEFEALLTPQPPQTFQGDGFTLTYPGRWETTDISGVVDCKQPGVECLISIVHPSGDGTNINLMRFALAGEATLEEIDQALWVQFESVTPDVNLESRDIIEVGGQPAVRRVYSLPSSKASSGRAHILQVWIVNGLTLYQFTGWTPSDDALKQHQAEIEGIVTSIQFTP